MNKKEKKITSPKINSIEYLLIVTILSSVELLFIGTFYYFIIHSIIGLLISGDFIFSFEILKKIIKASVVCGIIAGIGNWFIEYKLRR